LISGRAPHADDVAATDPPWLGELLVDPGSSQSLRLDAEGAHSPTQLVAPRRAALLRFVDSDAYARSFGKEWNWFADTQLDRPDEEQTESRQAFALKTGFSPEDLEGKTILDVGCGMGRFAEVASAWGARVVGVDLSVAAEAAQRNLGDRPNTAFLQADVFNLPLRPESFDLIYSIGVLHHTPDTHAAFAQLPRLLRPGGRIAIWVYTRQRRVGYFSSDVYRRLTTRMDEERLLGLCKLAKPLGRFYRTRPGRYFTPLLPVSCHPDPEWRVLDTFDWYAPRYQWKHDWPEVEGWFEQAGLEDIRRQDFEIAVSGRRPG
jgi:SAM-dependent methyltransferase